MRPLRRFVLASAIAVTLALVLWVVLSSSRSPTLRNFLTNEEDDYFALESQINALEVQQLIAKEKDAKLTVAEIDKQLAPLKAKLAELQPRHEQAVEERRLQQKAEARRREEQQIKAMQQKEADLKKRCEDIKSKRVADLTVNDLELLKTCGISIPRFPVE